MALVFPSPPPKYKMYDKSALSKEKEWDVFNVHDPSIFKDFDGYYYIFSTDTRAEGKSKPGIQIRRSPDLINWEWWGRAFAGIPQKAGEWSGASDLWAPEVFWMKGYYYLYYSASTFGSQRSAIGVARSKSIAGSWDDLGIVVKTSAESVPNAIDPNIVTDRKGRPWLVYGSFFGGIFITRLNPDTGKLLNPEQQTLLARRADEVDNAVEGPYVIYNPQFDKFYLFVSYGSLSSNYNIRVGRSDEITGPYRDFRGHRLTDVETNPYYVGNKLVAGYKFTGGETWKAPGHNSVLKDGDDYFLVHHARGGKNPRWAYLHLRKLLWSQDGWPLVSPERYSGEVKQSIPRKVLPGKWEFIKFKPADNNIANPITVNCKISENSLRKLTDNVFQIKLGTEFQGRIIPCWDWENWQPALAFTGKNKKGLSLWGKRIRK